MRRFSGALVLLALLAFAGYAGAGETGAPEGDAVRLGARLYEQHCGSCHGQKGEGAPDWQTPNAQGELPPPPHGPKGHTWRHPDAELLRMIHEGWRDPFNKTERLTMPPFKDVLSEREIRAVIAYLKMLWTPEQRRYQAQESDKRGTGAERP